jgi:hypothetical protein
MSSATADSTSLIQRFSVYPLYAPKQRRSIFARDRQDAAIQAIVDRPRWGSLGPLKIRPQ